MTEALQPTASVGKATAPPVYSVMFSNSGVTDHPAYYVIPERMLIGAESCASLSEVEMLLPSKVVPDCGMR